MITLRNHLKAIISPGLMHEDELIDFMQSHAEAALKILDDADWALDGWQQDFVPVREIPDPAVFTLGGPHAPKEDANA